MYLRMVSTHAIQQKPRLLLQQIVINHTNRDVSEFCDTLRHVHFNNSTDDLVLPKQLVANLSNLAETTAEAKEKLEKQQDADVPEDSNVTAENEAIICQSELLIEEGMDVPENINFECYARSYWNTRWSVASTCNGLTLSVFGGKIGTNVIQVHVTCKEHVWECITYVYGKPLTTHSPMHSKCSSVRSLESLSELIREFDSWKVCAGIPNDTRFASFTHNKTGYICDFTDNIRTYRCQMLSQKSVCLYCKHYSYSLNKRLKNALKGGMTTNDHCNNRFLTRDQLIAKLDEKNKEVYAARRRIRLLRERYEKRLTSNGVSIGKKRHAELAAILTQLSDRYESNDFRKIFIEEQLKASARKTTNGYKWHPAMIKFALYMHNKSPGAYNAMRHILLLPSQRLLRDYSKEMSSKPGLRQPIPEEILRLVNMEDENARADQMYFALIWDEIKIS